MKWNNVREFEWFFAILPHQCHRCDFNYWLEKGIRRENYYGETKTYCKDCAPYEWKGAIPNRKEPTHE